MKDKEHKPGIVINVTPEEWKTTLKELRRLHDIGALMSMDAGFQATVMRLLREDEQC